MFFTLSKVFWMVFSPANFMVILLLAVIFCLANRLRIKRKPALAIIILLIVVSLFPFGEITLQQLEGRYPVPELPARIDGIILLGGFIETDTTVAHHQIQMNGNADRFTTTLMLARHYPNARLVFTGGAGSLFNQRVKEADLFLTLWHAVGHEMGPGDKNLIVENQSRNTYENAVYSKNLVHPKAGETWLLVTSAAHMPRAMKIFQKQGWPVVAYPCAYESDGGPIFTPDINVLRNWEKLNTAVKEYIGLLIYQWSGRA